MNGTYSALDVSGSALTAQRKRLEILVTNLANSETTRTAEGGPYRRKDVVMVSRPFRSFYEHFVETASRSRLEGVEVREIVVDDSPPVLRYEPNHPDADVEGYVAYPNVNPMKEMADLLMATRAFEANVRAFESVRTMVARSIELGRTR